MLFGQKTLANSRRFGRKSTGNNSFGHKSRSNNRRNHYVPDPVTNSQKHSDLEKYHANGQHSHLYEHNPLHR